MANEPEHEHEDELAQRLLIALRDGTREEKIGAREGLARIFEERGLLDDAAECYLGNLRAGTRAEKINAREGLAGIFVTAYFTLWETSIQEQIPANAVSRVGSYDLLVSVGLLPFGTAIFAPLSEVLGLQETLVLMSATGVTAAVCVLSVPSVRRLARP